jgi:fructokinase
VQNWGNRQSRYVILLLRPVLHRKVDQPLASLNRPGLTVMPGLLYRIVWLRILRNVFGGIEAGGTKFVCGVGTGPEDLETIEVPTTSPETTLRRVTAFFKERGGQLNAVGIGSFGPVDLDPSSALFGHITSTPKLGWQNYDLAGAVARALDVCVGFDTDVNAAALGEARWGAGRGLPDFIYLTIGTGIGGGAMVNGQLTHGLVHAEMGHLRIPHDLLRDPYSGWCPYHGDCLEGLASGPAMQARWGVPARELAPTHPAWALEAHYLALGVVNLALTLSPRRILMGGGVMQQPHLFGLIRDEFARLLNGYVRHSEVIDRLDKYIMPPQLGGRAGVLGSLILAEGEFFSKSEHQESQPWTSGGENSSG